MNDTFIVSDQLVDIFLNFNVTDQREQLTKLSNKDYYVLLNLCIDLHSEEDPQVIQNLSTSAAKISNLRTLFETGESTDVELRELSLKYGRYLNILVEDSLGNELPNPYTKEEVRELKLNKIFD
jgi:hypothetical protein